MDVEGAVNETFLRLIGSRRPIQDPTAWLFVVTHNQVRKAARLQGKVADGDPAGHIEGGRVGWTSLVPRASSEDLRSTWAAMRVIAELPDQQKIATYLSRVQEWTLAEIGEYLECAASTAGVHVHRGTKQLRRELAPRYSHEPMQIGDAATPSAPIGLRGVLLRFAGVAMWLGIAYLLARWLDMPIWLVATVPIVAFLVLWWMLIGILVVWMLISDRRARRERTGAGKTNPEPQDN